MKSKILDRVYMMLLPSGGVVYSSVATNPADVWEYVLKMGVTTWSNKKDMQRMGFRAKKVEIRLCGSK